MPPNEADAATGSGSESIFAEVPAAWAARATELAGWALERIFVRTDRHGGYATEAGELQKKTFPTTGPRDGAVNLARVERHFRARSHEDIIGAHTLAPGTSVGKWCALDCDNHGDAPQLPELNRQYAEGRHAFLTNLGFRPLVLDYGKGSIHIVVLFDRLLPGAVLKRFAEWLRDDEQQHEVFPKQSEVAEGKFGNWLRLVGRHHTRDVWARVYDGANWLDGAAAVAHLLALTDDSPDLIPEAVRFHQDAPKAEPKQTVSTDRESIFETYNRTATLDELIGHCEAAGHKLLKREGDRATFTRAGKAVGESLNLRAMQGTVFCYNFSANAGLPDNKGLNPSHTRCALRFGSVSKDGLRQLAPILEAELGVLPRRMPLQAVFTNASETEISGADEADEQCTNPPPWWEPPAEGEAWRGTNASRYVRMFQSRRSLLVWKVFGERLDGWTNDDFPTETTPGDSRTLALKGAPVPDTVSNRNRADLDFVGSVMPPPDAVKSGKVHALSAEDKLTLVRWIDLGCPIDLTFDPKNPAKPGFGWMLDDQRPTLSVALPKAGANPPLERFVIGMHDYGTGLDAASFAVTADFAVSGAPPGTNLAPKFVSLGGQVFELKLSAPLSVARGTLTVSVKDKQGNVTRVERTFGAK